MAHHNYRYNAEDGLKGVTMTVEVVVVNLWRVRLRLWIATRLIRLAAWVGGYNLVLNQRVGVIVTEQPGREMARRHE